MSRTILYCCVRYRHPQLLPTLIWVWNYTIYNIPILICFRFLFVCLILILYTYIYIYIRLTPDWWVIGVLAGTLRMPKHIYICFGSPRFCIAIRYWHDSVCVRNTHAKVSLCWWETGTVYADLPWKRKSSIEGGLTARHVGGGWESTPSRDELMGYTIVC